MSNCSASVENSLREIAIELRAIRKELHKQNNPFEDIKPVQISLDIDTKYLSDNPYQE